MIPTFSHKSLFCTKKKFKKTASTLFCAGAAYNTAYHGASEPFIVAYCEIILALPLLLMLLRHLSFTVNILSSVFIEPLSHIHLIYIYSISRVRQQQRILPLYIHLWKLKKQFKTWLLESLDCQRWDEASWNIIRMLYKVNFTVLF